MKVVESLLSAKQNLNANDMRILKDVKLHAHKEGFYQVKYSYGKGSDSGRIFSAGKGYPAVSAEIRSMCASRYYVEDDMSNAFPTILNQLFIRAGLSTPNLTNYVNNREEIY